MDAADLKDYVEFSDAGPIRGTVFESERMLVQVVCLDRNRRYGPLGDPSSDAFVTVLAGEAVLQVDRSRKRLKQWGSVLVPAGTELVAANASPDPLVLLMVVAPPPPAEP